MADVPAIHIAIFVAHSPQAELKPLQNFAEQIAIDCQEILNAATSAEWVFHTETPNRLDTSSEHHPPDFMDEANTRMAEGPYDAVVVVTDVPLLARNRRQVAGLASPIARIMVLSTKRLRTTPRGQSHRELDDQVVLANGVSLVLHLMGHVLGLKHGRGIMAPWRFDTAAAMPTARLFEAIPQAQLSTVIERFPQHSKVSGGFFTALRFHVHTAVRHPQAIFKPILRNRAPLLALALPRLSTAAVVPTFILVFSAEMWDVALFVPTHVVIIMALGSLLASTIYMTFGLNLFFPQQAQRVLTEHAAVVNNSIFLSVLVGMAGLFLMITAVMLGIEFFIFPPDLMKEWPSLDNPVVSFGDQLRLAVFISAIGGITGALAGGLESRTVIRQFALFLERP